MLTVTTKMLHDYTCIDFAVSVTEGGQGTLRGRGGDMGWAGGEEPTIHVKLHSSYFFTEKDGSKLKVEPTGEETHQLTTPTLYNSTVKIG